MRFRERESITRRKEESAKIREKYPERVPVICERHNRAPVLLPDIDKNKYLVPSELTLGQFSFVIRKRLKLKEHNSLMIYTEDGTLPTSASTLAHIYTTHKNEDGFLYLTFSTENTFG